MRTFGYLGWYTNDAVKAKNGEAFRGKAQYRKFSGK